MKVLTIGGATYDIFIGYDAPQMVMIDKNQYIALPEGQKIDIQSACYYSGGGATNSATSFARLGFSVSSFFKIGADLQGAFIIDQLKKEPIGLHHLIDKREQTSSSFIMPSSSGDSAILVYRGANSTITRHDIPFDLIAEQNQLYITSLSGPAAGLLPHVTEHAHKHAVSVAVNPGGSQLTYGMQSLCAALPFIDTFILNSYEAHLFMNTLVDVEKKFNISRYMQTILERGPKIVAVTDGAHGVYVAYDNEMIFHKSISANVVSTVGAGDAFGSCFVAQLARGKNIDYAIRAGIINSASVISHVGAKVGLLDQISLDKRLAQMNKNFLSRYPLY